MPGQSQYYIQKEEAVKALGDLSGLPDPVRPFFRIDDFELKKTPGPHDWLANHSEPGQTHREYINSHPNRITKQRRIIYIQPLGKFSSEEEKIFSAMREFLKAYFQTDTVLLPLLPLDKEKTVWRKNPYTGHPQVLAGSIMDSILLPGLSADAFCLLGVTTVDLYPAPSWNFVFGQASLKYRTGIYSLARYDPAFYGSKVSPEERQQTVLRRALKVAAHETGHMFGLNHCIYFECIMNGSNHMEESDSRPLFLCPVCLMKLYWNLGFDIASRYRALHPFFTNQELLSEAEWCRERLDKNAN